MSHYTSEQWIDFARGLSPESEVAGMRHHLDLCAKCSRTALPFESAARLAASDRRFVPPAPLVATVERIFAPVKAENTHDSVLRLRRLAATLQWDSFGSALPEGVRSVGANSRHIVYLAGRYSVDLVVDTDAESETVTVTGQVANEAEPGRMPGILKPVLVSGVDFIFSTKSTKWGEFSMQSRGHRKLDLLIPLEQTGECIELPIPCSDVP